MNWDERFLSLAEHVASWSKDPSTKTGAVIVRPNKTVASLGYNGYPQKIRDDETLFVRDEKLKRIVHCEMNAVLFARESLSGYTLYTWPFMSCERCCVHMIQAGIVRFVAPKSDNPRWQESFALTRALCAEANAELVEL